MPSSKKKTTLARASRAPIPIRALDFVMYHTKNMRKTRQFYQKLFGLGKGEEWNDSWSEFNTEPLVLCLDAPKRKPRPEGAWSGPPCVALAVEDVVAAVKVCRQRRVKVLFGPIETRVCWMAWIADPDGNPICLHSRKNGTAG